MANIGIAFAYAGFAAVKLKYGWSACQILVRYSFKPMDG